MHPPSISKPRPLANQMRAVALPTAVLVATALAWVCLHEAPAVRRSERRRQHAPQRLPQREVGRVAVSPAPRSGARARRRGFEVGVEAELCTRSDGASATSSTPVVHTQRRSQHAYPQMASARHCTNENRSGLDDVGLEPHDR